MNDSRALPAPHAIPSNGRLGRPVKEPEDDTRGPFQRDRDRIIHADAFRRLQGKTQVFLAGTGDHYRSRLTHTMEVAQIARDLARRLRLNEDVAEAIALAHDLGHPPFGHRGEEALDKWMRQQGGHFEHNEQSLRIVTLLEQHAPLIPGLNLNLEILEGLQKHAAGGKVGDRSLSLESQTVNIADAIAYSAHDCDDGMRAGLFALEDLKTVPLAAEAALRAQARGTPIRGAIIHLLVQDLYAETAARIEAQSIRTIDDVDNATMPLVGFSSTMEARLDELKAFLWERMYSHSQVTEAGAAGQQIILTLCDRLLAEPTTNVLDLKKRTGGTLVEAVKDYVAGMTDGFATEAAR